MTDTSELEDFDLVCLLLEGDDDAADEFLNRAPVPAGLAVQVAIEFLGREGWEPLDPQRTKRSDLLFDFLEWGLSGEQPMLRNLPDGATLKEWLPMVALEFAKSELLLEPTNESESPQARLPLAGRAPELTPRMRFVAGLLQDGCNAATMGRILDVTPSSASRTAYETRRKLTGGAPEDDSQCGISQPLLSMFIDHALKVEERDKLRAHIGPCPACTRRVRRLRSAPRRLAAPTRRSRCPALASRFRYARRLLPARLRDELEDHAATCRPCRQTLRFDLTYRPYAPPTRIDLPSNVLTEGRQRLRKLLGISPPLVGFGVHEDICRVLYTTGIRGTDVFVSETRVTLCEGVNLEVKDVRVRIKCLPEVVEGDERSSIGVVFDGLNERLPVFLDLESEGEKQVTLRQGGVEFRFIRPGTHVLRFGRWKGLAVHLDIRPYEPRYPDLLQVADRVFERAQDAEGTPLEIALFYRMSDLTLRAAATRPGDPQSLLRLLRARLAKPIPQIDPVQLASTGRTRAADRNSYLRFLAAGPIRAIGWVRSASSDPEVAAALRPLARVYVAAQGTDRDRLLESLTALRAHALPDDADTDRYAGSLRDWLTDGGTERALRSDQLDRLGTKYVDGLIARLRGSAPLDP